MRSLFRTLLVLCALPGLPLMAKSVSHTLTVTDTGTGTGTVTSSPAGISCGATCSASFPSGTVVRLTATPVSGSAFAGWSGACSGTGACSVTMNAATSVTAMFRRHHKEVAILTVADTGTGIGTVTSSPAGISCGATCSASFRSGTVVSLTATPASGSAFAGWSGACRGTGACSVTMKCSDPGQHHVSPWSQKGCNLPATSVSAMFRREKVATSETLTVTDTGTGTGTVTSSPAGISCGATCSASFASGTMVSLTATPASGSAFAGWSGACSGTGACSVTMNAATSVTAMFRTEKLAFVQGAAAQATSLAAGETWTVTLTDPTTAGDLIAISIGMPNTSGTVSILDCPGTSACSSGTNFYVIDADSPNSGGSGFYTNIFRASPLSVTSTSSVQSFTITTYAACTYCTALVEEFSGESTIHPADGLFVTNSGNSAAPSCTDTLGENGEALTGYFSGASNVTAESPTLVGAVPSIPTGDVALYEIFGSASGSQTLNATMTSESWYTSCQAYRPYNSSDAPSPQYFPVAGLAPRDITGINGPTYHSLNGLVKNTDNGFSYQGFVGPYAGPGVYLFETNSLTGTWTAYSGNPVNTDCRWPSVIYSGGTYYVACEVDYTNGGSTSPYVHIEEYTFTSVTGSWTDAGTLVSGAPNTLHQNPNLFVDPNSGKFCLAYFYESTTPTYNLNLRCASTVEGLASASDTPLASSANSLASPTIYYDSGTAAYYLLAEQHVTGPTSPGAPFWQVVGYINPTKTVTNTYTAMPGPQLLGQSTDYNEACPAQWNFSGTLALATCFSPDNSSDWNVNLRTYTLSNGIAYH